MLTKGYVSTVSILGACAIVLALAIMRLSTPISIGPLGVTAWFILVLSGITGLLSAAVYGVSLRLQPKLKASKRIAESFRRGLLMGGGVTILLALSSLRQLNIRDGILLVILLLLVEFYAVARS